MKFRILLDEKSEMAAIHAAIAVFVEMGAEMAEDESGHDVVAICPSLTRILPQAEIDMYGAVLVLHPSLLPTRRGPSAVKWAVVDGDGIGGVTWFWACTGLDNGDICSQEAFHIRRGAKAREVYEAQYIPAMARTLRTAIREMMAGYFRRVPQVLENGSYQPRYVNGK